MNGLSVLIISICLGVLVVAGIKAIIIDIKDMIVSRRISKMLENNPELSIKVFELKQKMQDIINGVD